MNPKNNNEKPDPIQEKHLAEMLEITNRKLRESFKGENVILESHDNLKTYSQIFHEFMQPAIEKVIFNEKLLNSKLIQGQIVWNKAVAEAFPDHERSRSYELIFPIMKNSIQDKSFITLFLNRKKRLFANENYFIMHLNSFSDGKGALSISVAVLPVEK